MESLAFVPLGFSKGGAAYYSDRVTPGNAHPGTDSLLRLTSSNLAGAGAHDGDLLGATEGGATMVDVRCDVTCHVFTVVSVASTSHGEGHIAFTVNPIALPSNSPVTSPGATPAAPNREPLALTAVLAGLLVIAASIALLARRGRLKR